MINSSEWEKHLIKSYMIILSVFIHEHGDNPHQYNALRNTIKDVLLPVIRSTIATEVQRAREQQNKEFVIDLNNWEKLRRKHGSVSRELADYYVRSYLIAKYEGEVQR